MAASVFSRRPRALPSPFVKADLEASRKVTSGYGKGGVRDAAPYGNHPARWSSDRRGVVGAAPYNGRVAPSSGLPHHDPLWQFQNYAVIVMKTM